MIVYHAIAIILAYVIDLVIGDPRHLPHPVKWMGACISFLDKKLNKGKRKRLKGLIMLMLLLLLVFGISFSFVYLFYQWHVIAGILLEGLLIATTIAQKDLKRASLAVLKPLRKKNIAEARKQLSF